MTDPPGNPLEWLASLYQAGQQTARPVAPTATDAGADPFAPFAAMSRAVLELQQSYLRQMSSLWLGIAAGAAPIPVGTGPETDRRFAGAPWRDDPRFELLTRAYLAHADLLQKSVETAAVDDATRTQLRFAVRQFVDAASPANFFATNPEAMQLALETGGASLTAGMGLLFKDLARGRISMTDESAFEVGGNIAATEGSVIFENDLIQVIQYAPRTAEVFARPLVMIPPCINKFYILDLTPENSFVRHALDLGHTVFMLSWRNITRQTAHFTWDDYLEQGVNRAIDVAREVTGAAAVNALGFCIGGTLLSCATAAMKAKGEEKVASLTLLTAMLDFGDPGEIGALISEQSVAEREARIGTGGVIPGSELALTFSSLRANDLIWPYVVNSYLKGKSPPPFDLLYWNSDGTNLPGPMFCWYVRNAYLENIICEPGGTVQCGVPVDLADVDVPAFIYSSREDHIVPWRSAYASTALLGGENRFVLGASGHIAGVINAPAKKKRNYWIDGTPGAEADEWLAGAHEVPGSWWPAWAEWLAPHAGARIAAPRKPGSRRHRPLEPAPGRYVKARAE